MRIALTGEFTTLDVTEGTLQNVSRQVPIEIATTTTKDTGIILQPGESIQFQSDAAVYARSVEMNPEARETPYLAHVPFKGKGEGGEESNNSRKASTAYEVGDIAYLSSLSLGKKLVCVAAGTTASGGLAPASTDEGAIVTDGTVKWAIDSMADGIYNAAHHNSYYRGADITAYFESGDMSTNIANGVFANIYPGDYITKSVSIPETTYADKSGNSVTQPATAINNVNWVIAGCDSYLYAGNTVTTTHHVLMISETTLMVGIKMNPTASTDGGYLASDMWTVHMPIWTSALQTAFGSTHLLPHNEILTDATNASVPSGNNTGIMGASSHGVWTSNVTVNIPNEVMVYGSRIFSSSAYDNLSPNRILPYFLFKQINRISNTSQFTWLRSISDYKRFTVMSAAGQASHEDANTTTQGIRPYFLLK